MATIIRNRINRIARRNAKLAVWDQLHSDRADRAAELRDRAAHKLAEMNARYDREQMDIAYASYGDYMKELEIDRAWDHYEIWQLQDYAHAWQEYQDDKQRTAARHWESMSAYWYN